MYCSDSSDSDSDSGEDNGSIVFPFPTGSPVKSTLRFTESSNGGTGEQPALPPLPLKDMSDHLAGVSQPPTAASSSARAGGQQHGQDNKRQQSPRQQPPAAEALSSLTETKRRLVLHNASIAPTRCGEEDVVVQRFGEHMQRIPTPPVSKEAIHLVNSKEEKHLQNRLRLYGSVDNMQKVHAGGVATMQKVSHKTVRCDRPLGETATSTMHTNHSSSSNSRAGTAPRSSHGARIGDVPPPPPSFSTPKAHPMMTEANHLNHVFADVAFMERQQLMQYMQHPVTPSNANEHEVGHHPATPGQRYLPSREGGGGGNNFFLVSRASHKERALLQSSMSARGGGVFPAISSPRTPATAGRTTSQSGVRDGGTFSRSGATSQVNIKPQLSTVSPRTLSSVAGSGRLSPRSSRLQQAALAQLSDPDEFVVEDTSYVVQATKHFEKGVLATAKRSWMEARSQSTADIAARAENHTSDLLKMIFNARIALECDVATRLRQFAEESGVEKLITDAINTAQRLALRTANVSDFHLFLCNLLRDTDLSFSEARVIFGAIDSNHSGSIDQGELSEGLRLLLLDESQLILTFAKKVFTEVGRHKDTKLSFLEVQAIYFAALDFFETEFDAFDVIDGAHLDPKASTNANGEGEGDLQTFPSVNMMQQAKLLSNKSSGQKGGGQPRMVKTNTLQSPRRLSGDYSDDRSQAITTTTTAPVATGGAGLSRMNSMMFGGGGGPSSPVAPPSPPPPLEKPTLVGLKKRMVKECSTALREVWKYSQGGQIVVPLLRSLTMQAAPLLFQGLTHVPVQHFNLKQSGFWKTTLSVEETKYQQYVEQRSIEAEIQRTNLLAASALGASMRSSSTTKKGGNRGGGDDRHQDDFILGASVLVPATPRIGQRTGGSAFAAAAPQSSTAHHARKMSTTSVKDDGVDNELIAQLMELQQQTQQQQQSQQAGGGAAPFRKSSFAVGGGRRQSLSKHNASISSLAGLQPISYEEYEEACGDVVNISALQAQLRDGSLRLSQAQRQMIAQQIEVGKEARAAAAAANARGDRKSLSGFSGAPPAATQRRGPALRGGASNKSTVIVGAGEEESKAEPRDDAFIQALQRKKSEGGSKGMRGGAPDRIDLTEVVDPWHPRFQADHDKLSDQRRQLNANEHNHSEYFSKQGHVFTKTPNGVIAPLSPNEATTSSGSHGGRR